MRYYIWRGNEGSDGIFFKKSGGKSLSKIDHIHYTDLDVIQCTHAWNHQILQCWSIKIIAER